jgi:hypothetical protein
MSDEADLAAICTPDMSWHCPGCHASAPNRERDESGYICGGCGEWELADTGKLISQLASSESKQKSIIVHGPKWRRVPVRITTPQGEPSAQTRAGGGSPLVAKPIRLLTGWIEITAALDMQKSDWKKIKSLNDRRGGPIKNRGRGTQPMVNRDVLIEWWNGLDAQTEESANRRDGERASAETQHNYGRSGTAAPEIGGEVKKRRRHTSE